MEDSESSIFDRIMVELSKTFIPLKTLTTPERVTFLMKELGWELPGSEIFELTFPHIINEITNLMQFSSLYEKAKTIEEKLDAIGNLVGSIIKITEGIYELVIDIEHAVRSFPSFIEESKILERFPKRLFDYLIIEYLRDYQPEIFSILHFVGIVELELREQRDEIYQPSFILRELRWDRFPLLVKPLDLANEIYSWEVSFNSNLLLERFAIIMKAFSLPGGLYIQNEKLREELGKDEIDNIELRVPIFQTGRWPESYIETGIHISSYYFGSKKGLAILPYLFGSESLEIPLSELWQLSISCSANFNDGISLTFLPPKEVKIRNDLLKTALIPSDFSFGIKLLNKKELMLIGSKNSSHLSLKNSHLALTANKTNSNPEEVMIEIGIEELKFLLQKGDGDGFIQKVLPEDPIGFVFNLTLGYSSVKGFYIKLGAGFEIAIQINKQLGPIYLSIFYLKFDINENNLSILTTISGGVQIGPISAAIDKIGLRTELALGTKGKMGDADLVFKFQPPSGIGIGVDASVVKGGGFLSVDKPNYFGIIALSVQEKFDITAIGLLTTKLPDGSDIFSLLFMLTAEFSPPIQLSFGFALSGVGGLIGIHRTMSEEALRAAQKAHTLDTLLFPEDPIRDATLILANIKSIFPVKEGRFVFGPLVKIFWGGAVPLVEFSAGIFIELGGPVRIAIIGRAHAALPKPKSPIITLNMDILGFIDFGNKTLAIDSSLYNSNILKKFDLVGDMALRSNWGDNPDFALSLGGFHPRFNPPPGFPNLKRLGIKFGKKNPRLSCTMYLAITTNSFQTGSMVDLFAKAGPFKATAGFGFDTLIYFKPFSFLAEIYAWAKVSGLGISIGADLRFSLSGPNPYRAKGHVVVEILKREVKVKFNKKFGNTKSEDPIISEPAKVLHEQLENAKPIYEIPDWAYGGVLLTEDGEEFLSPVGELNISQNAVPLDFQMDLFAEGVPPSNEKKLSLEITRVDTNEPVQLNTDDPPKAHFAPAKFKKMSDNEKISAPSFEKYKSGERIVGNGAVSNNNCEKTVEFETILRNPDEEDIECNEFSIGQLQTTKALYMKKIWTMQGAAKHFKPLNKAKDKTRSQYIEVKEQEYTVTKHIASNGEFERVDEEGEKAANMTYHEAMDLAKKQGRKDVIIRDSAFAEEI